MQAEDRVTMADVREISEVVDGYIQRSNPNGEFVNRFSIWGKELGGVIKKELGITSTVVALALGIVTDKTELGPMARDKFSQFLKWLDAEGFKIS